MRRVRQHSVQQLAERHGARSDDTGRILTTRKAVATVTERHVNLVRRLVPPVACDVKSKTALLDLDDAERILRDLPRRAGSSR